MAEGNSQSRYVKLTKDQAPLEDIAPGELNQPIQVPQLIVHRCSECGQPLPESYQPPADEDWTTGICACAEDTESSWENIPGIFRIASAIVSSPACGGIVVIVLAGFSRYFSQQVVSEHGYHGVPRFTTFILVGWTGLFCPCILFGRNVETLREDVPWQNACVCHALCIEGGMTLAAATALFNGIDPHTSFLICESLIFAWWICGIYTGLFRQSLQKNYHLKNSPCDPCAVHCCLHWCAICQEHREMKNHLSENATMQMTEVNPPPVQEMNSGNNNKSEPSSPSAPSAGKNEQTSLELQSP